MTEHRNHQSTRTLTLVDLLGQRARESPEQVGYLFLPEGEGQALRFTYGELDHKARAIAVGLWDRCRPGDRALVLYPPGFDYIAAFFGCLYAQVIPIPLYPPRPNRSLLRIQAVQRDAQASIVLATAEVRATVEHRITRGLDQDRLSSAHAFQNTLLTLPWQVVEDWDLGNADPWQSPIIHPSDLAFLQYTSGSTAAPKGVRVSHSNLMANLKCIQQAFRGDSTSMGVSWLPPYHDMGLVGGILVPLWMGSPVVLFPPAAFLQRPLRWLEAISNYQAVISGGPNFAFDLCALSAIDQDISHLDLGHWRIAFSGSEPIRSGTLARFAEVFRPSGFRSSSFLACYGMAETTLLATATPPDHPPQQVTVEAEELRRHRIKIDLSKAQSQGITLVSCGHPPADHHVQILDPQTGQPCDLDQVGEIWISGPSVTQGYFNQPQLTDSVFQIRQGSISSCGVRTGDLGFCYEGELYVCGRIKDLIVIRGQNHYPQDIEATVETCHPAIRTGCVAAFASPLTQDDSTETLIIVAEIERQYRHQDLEPVLHQIRITVAEKHEIPVGRVALLKPGTIPKTSSGKIQRFACRDGLIEQKLVPLLDHRFTAMIGEGSAWELTRADLLGLSTVEQEQKLLEFLRHQIGLELRLSLTDLDHNPYLNRLGLDSMAAVQLKGQIETAFEISLPMTRFLEDVSLSDLVQEIVHKINSTPDLATSGMAASGSTPPSLRQVRSILSEPTLLKVDPSSRDQSKIDFSLFYFSSNEAEFSNNKYQLFLEGAKFADHHGFTAVWAPERHFHSFGGLYPNPSVLCSALAMITERIRLRAGSIVLPLHHPVRVAEEWAVVDNLSQGRVDLAFATGWNANDFIFAPHHYSNRRDILYQSLKVLKDLWQGKAISYRNGLDQETSIRIYPLPAQPDLNIWITCSGGVERFAEAGAVGANILTALLFQPIEDLEQKIAIYRNSRREHGFDPDSGQVTLMLHTYIGPDKDTVRQQVQVPFTHYLRTSADLWQQMSDRKLVQLSPREQEDLLTFAFERYYQTSALFGTPETCKERVGQLQAAGVNEIACLIDFGIDPEAVMTGLTHLNHLKDLCQSSRVGKDLDPLRPTQISGEIGAQQAAYYLAHLDQLSDEEVEQLLQKLQIPSSSS